jgi:hypothetical protein
MIENIHDFQISALRIKGEVAADLPGTPDDELIFTPVPEK